MEVKYERLYEDITINRKKSVLYYPVFFFKRWLMLL